MRSGCERCCRGCACGAVEDLDRFIAAVVASFPELAE